MKTLANLTQAAKNLGNTNVAAVVHNMTPDRLKVQSVARAALPSNYSPLLATVLTEHLPTGKRQAKVIALIVVSVVAITLATKALANQKTEAVNSSVQATEKFYMTKVANLEAILTACLNNKPFAVDKIVFECNTGSLGVRLD